MAFVLLKYEIKNESCQHFAINQNHIMKRPTCTSNVSSIGIFDFCFAIPCPPSQFFSIHSIPSFYSKQGHFNPKDFLFLIFFRKKLLAVHFKCFKISLLSPFATHPYMYCLIHVPVNFRRSPNAKSSQNICPISSFFWRISYRDKSR